jgi:cell shape-determining protein MreC
MENRSQLQLRKIRSNKIISRKKMLSKLYLIYKLSMSMISNLTNKVKQVFNNLSQLLKSHQQEQSNLEYFHDERLEKLTYSMNTLSKESCMIYKEFFEYYKYKFVNDNIKKTDKASDLYYMKG